MAPDLLDSLPPADPAETRREARDSIEPARGRLLRAVAEYIDRRGPMGATDEEVCRALSIRISTGTARRCELRDAGDVVASPWRRRTESGRSAVVWIAARFAHPDAPRPATIEPQPAQASTATANPAVSAGRMPDAPSPEPAAHLMATGEPPARAACPGVAAGLCGPVRDAGNGDCGRAGTMPADPAASAESDGDGWPAGAVAPGTPCPRCDGLAVWWDATGGRHCQHCDRDALARSLRLADLAARARQRWPIRAREHTTTARPRAGGAVGNTPAQPTKDLDK